MAFFMLKSEIIHQHSYIINLSRLNTRWIYDVWFKIYDVWFSGM